MLSECPVLPNVFGLNLRKVEKIERLVMEQLFIDVIRLLGIGIDVYGGHS